MPEAPEGLLVLDKASGWTSHDVVAKLRGVLGTRRVGHAGTLDPDATGVLLVGVGRVTRLLRFLTALPKEYSGSVVLGVETSTLDSSGEVTATHDMTEVSIEAVRSAAQGLTGEILQVPPMVSALQVGGVRLHTLARQGIEVERAARPVIVHEFVVEPTDDPLVLRIRVRCSSGTYVRSLAADLGRLLGGGAHLRDLRRIAIGSFRVEEAKPIEAVGNADLMAPAAALRDLPAVRAGADVVAAARTGKVLATERLGVSGDGPWAVLGDDGALVAVYEPYREATVKPAVVLG